MHIRATRKENMQEEKATKMDGTEKGRKKAFSRGNRGWKL